MVHNRVFKQCEASVTDDHFGFSSGMGTREVIFTVQNPLKKYHDQRKNTFCFIDLEKVFDTINHGKLLHVNKTLDWMTEIAGLIINWTQTKKLIVEFNRQELHSNDCNNFYVTHP